MPEPTTPPIQPEKQEQIEQTEQKPLPYDSDIPEYQPEPHNRDGQAIDWVLTPQH